MAMNYTEQGGAKTVIEGDLVISGALKFGDAELKQAENQAASTATDVAGVVADLNALLLKLKAAGLMKADET